MHEISSIHMIILSVACGASSAGSNGHEFMFLLKGHEDLRQDERVMQLFGLVNTLLANDPASLRKNLRYTPRETPNAKTSVWVQTSAHTCAVHAGFCLGISVALLALLHPSASSATPSSLCPPTRG